MHVHTPALASFTLALAFLFPVPDLASADPFHAQPAEEIPGVRSLPAPPADAMELNAATRTTAPGDPITLRGRIELAKGAFDPSTARFTLADDCAAAEHWPADNKPLASSALQAEHTALMQVVDGAGAPLAGSLEGKAGLKPGSEVFVQGVVDRASTPQALVVNVQAIHVPAVALPPGLIACEQPTDAKDVSAVRASAEVKKGDRITLRGVIGGSREPFVENRAMFTLMGSALKPCNANPDDHCATPWDYCCDPPSEIAANAATIRVVDAKGKVLRTDLKSRGCVRELSEIIVVGVASVVEKGVLIVDAQSISIVTR